MIGVLFGHHNWERPRSMLKGENEERGTRERGRIREAKVGSKFLRRFLLRLTFKICATFKY